MEENFQDGIYAGLRVLELLSNTDKKLSSFFDDINKYYSTEELKIAVTDEEKFNIVNKMKEYCDAKKYQYNDIDGVRVSFEDSWALVRASNTGPNIICRFEAKTKERLNSLNNEFIEIINRITKK